MEGGGGGGIAYRVASTENRGGWLIKRWFPTIEVEKEGTVAPRRGQLCQNKVRKEWGLLGYGVSDWEKGDVPDAGHKEKNEGVDFSGRNNGQGGGTHFFARS